ncbi:hypothetical protein PR202_gb16624 [Eleusine coracana subsp. coracana]|uniref:Uncharacterized protein n=1 Tax=Eleusine coracana subsp. coracana TaxID=191504 RepID=A0AAV5F1I3_ELECO|nr:hypothetical protein PR202_gb16624 [Eleusine coracana subsp. coracana]
MNPAMFSPSAHFSLSDSLFAPGAFLSLDGLLSHGGGDGLELAGSGGDDLGLTGSGGLLSPDTLLPLRQHSLPRRWRIRQLPPGRAGPNCKIDWDIRFKIIKGVCEGIRFLHTRLTGPVVHMNLEPNSIWLDDNWVPKIADFGLSRLFGNDNSRIFTVHENWNNHQIESAYPSLDANGLQQVKACISIGLMCVELDRSKRPSIVDIVNKLNGKSIAIFDEIRSEPSSQEKITAMTTALLDVYPPQLRFPFKPDKLFSCPLRLTNMTGYWVAARLLTKNPKRYVAKMPLCGVVPPHSTYTLVVTMREPRKQHLLNGDEFLMLESSIIDEGDLCLKNADLDSAAMAFNSFFGEANSSAKVHKQTLKVVSDSYQGAASDKVVCSRKFVQVLSVDVHPTEPWIMTSHHGGDILIWDYVEQIEAIFNVIFSTVVYSAKFIEREEWLVAGDGDGTIYVYSYETDEEVTSIEAHEGDVTSLAVHPTSPFLLSSSDDRLIKLWDWEKGWECSKTFEGHTNRVTQVIFNPVDTDSFVSASLDRTIRIWNTASLETKTILTDDPLLCVHNYTSDFRHHLITGSWNGTSQVWDLQTESCVQTLEGHVNRISCVYRHPELPVVITGSYDGTVRLWNSTTYRLENIIGVNLGAVYSFGYIKDFRSTFAFDTM